MEKLTRKETFVKAMEFFKANDMSAEVEVMEKAIKALEKKSANKKPTATQIENETFKADILNYLGEVDRATITEIKANVSGLENANPQKVSSLLGQLIKSGLVDRNVEKKVVYFSLANEEEEEEE